ncbi:hypothetical protein RhiirA4_489842 [Rhizophagus irregularis]|uniref:Uncharacterized protein n=1 Tax=Rhizophagus irregularis TaxID=588596 RepID=A0A2I1HVA3_9GLOM|nr:hypothetical protein RhiirA4_489842 [Rhizophagus irregularis]
MILRPLIDTDFVMKTWWQKLGDVYVRWYLGYWKLKDRKERERFQAKLKIPADAPATTFKNYCKGQNFDDFLAKTLKIRSLTSIIDKGDKYLILFFESQNDLHKALEISQPWKLTKSHPPFQKKKVKSDKDKKKNLKSLKGKKADPKGSTSSNKSRDKSKKATKMNDDTRSLLKLILNLLS